LVAALMIPIMGLVALVIDAGRARLVSERLARAAEFGAMAGVQNLSAGEDAARDKAGDAFNAAFGTGVLGAVLNGDVEVTSGVQSGSPTITVVASAKFTTLFMQLFEYDELFISAEARARREGSAPPYSFQLVN
jgi:Flp pilus assembly protein TadG